MLSKNIEEAINNQINAEFWSAYLYLSMAMDCQEKGLPGIANWFEIQFQEEQAHAIKFKNYLISRGGRVILKPIDEVQTEWDSVLAMFEDTYKHEQIVTGLINDIYQLAIDERDFATQSMLNWFIDEQVEEEETALGLIDSVRLIGNHGYGMYKLDKDLATRVFVPVE